jgi:deoxyribodipyrimidine photolyase-related protein
MMEVATESRHVPSHAQRTALFLSAMRHFAKELTRRKVRVRYITLEDSENTGGFESEITRAAASLKPTHIVCTHPGEWRVLAMLDRVRDATGLPLNIVPDEHFLTTTDEFYSWAEGRSALTMEFFYREQRRKTGYLMEGEGKAAKPIGGTWNFDKENRLPFGKQVPDPQPSRPLTFQPDETTRAVFAAMTIVLPDLPGNAESFGRPVTRVQALAALDDFIEHRLASFGPFEDAMWSSEPTLYHSTLSSSLNLKLLNSVNVASVPSRRFAQARRRCNLSRRSFARSLGGASSFVVSTGSKVPHTLIATAWNSRANCLPSTGRPTPTWRA